MQPCNNHITVVIFDLYILLLLFSIQMFSSFYNCVHLKAWNVESIEGIFETIENL